MCDNPTLKSQISIGDSSRVKETYRRCNGQLCFIENGVWGIAGIGDDHLLLRKCGGCGKNQECEDNGKNVKFHACNLLGMIFLEVLGRVNVGSRLFK